MITNLNDFTNVQPDQVLIDQVIEEYLGTFERRMMVFENFNWDKPVFSEYSNQSMKPYLENLGTLIGEKVSTYYRVINSKSDLSYYMKTRGVIWDFSQSHGCQVWYFGFHGSPDGINVQDEIITKQDILELFDSKFSDFPNILYFSSCYLFEDDDDFGNELLKRSGSRGVFGFKNRIGFSVSTLVDLFLLINFFKYENGDPFDHLEEIYNNVIEGFPVSKEMGFTLYSS
jgi:hypothetical protein